MSSNKYILLESEIFSEDDTLSAVVSRVVVIINFSSSVLHVITLDVGSISTHAASMYLMRGPISDRTGSITVRVSSVPTLADGKSGVIRK